MSSFKRPVRRFLRCLPAFRPLAPHSMNGYVLLTLAIIAEVIATSSLKAAENFTRLWPSVLVVSGYVAAFWLLMQVMKTVPVGVAYAIWSGAGIVLVTLIASILYRQIPDLAAWLGIGLIIAGVAVIQLYSKMSH
ncbi:multidrug efflux SMR transporter [Cupriavidus sp. SW-Y-13]|uniref:DMT family transporter n=1 Tax=Cupriavidus sp. SW-Y-13 TaxID=2653854 RepID=UPI00351A671F